MKAAVLAGGSGGELAEAAGVGCRALVPLAGRPMARYVVDALSAARSVEEVFAVCSPDTTLSPEALGSAQAVVAGGNSFADTIAAAARAAGGGLLVLATADMPLLTPQAVDEATKFALDTGADLTYTVADADGVLSAFPATRRTIVRMREGRYTGGNLVVATSQALLHSLGIIERAFGTRKSIVGLALLLGPLFIVRLALGALTIDAAARRGSEVLQCKVAVHVTSHAEIGFDVDKPSDLRAAEVALAARGVAT